MKLLIHRPCSWGTMVPRCCTWLNALYANLPAYGVEVVTSFETRTTRIAVARNQAAQKALDEGADYLLSIDPDMAPDMYVGQLDEAKPFLPSSLEVLKEHPGSIVGAPAVGPRPRRECNVRLFTVHGKSQRQICPWEVTERVRAPRVEHVPMMGTGLMLVDVDVFRTAPGPWYQDVLTDDQQDVHTGQDIFFCWHAAESGVKTFCNWYSFAGHSHAEVLGCPGIDEYDYTAEWDNDDVAMSGPALSGLREIAGGSLRILEVGPGRSSYVLYDSLPDVYDILIDENQYVRDWMRQAESRGYDTSNVQLSDHPSMMWDQFKPSCDDYDLVVIDGPWGSNARQIPLDVLRGCTTDETTFVIDDVNREHEAALVEQLADGRQIKIVEDGERKTAFMTPVRSLVSLTGRPDVYVQGGSHYRMIEE